MPAGQKNTVTLHDVARLARVSIATVSAVLNEKNTVGAESKQRVVEAINLLGYRPHSFARSLKTGRSHAIGLVVPDVANPFYTEAMSGLEALARSRGYSVILTNSNEDPAQELQALQFLHSRHVDGIVLTCASGRMAIDQGVLRGCPIVFMDRLPAGDFSGRAVVVDNVDAAERATKHLIDLGHEKIAIIAGRLDLSVGAERLAGYKQAMRNAGLPIHDFYIEDGDFHAESGYRCGLRLISLPDPPTAVFASNNSMTLGLMRALAERHVVCPDSISVMGFDDFPWAEYFSPQLTTVAQPVLELGKQSMRMLLSMIEPETQEPSDVSQNRLILRAELRVRRSTCAPPGKICV